MPSEPRLYRDPHPHLANNKAGAGQAVARIRIYKFDIRFSALNLPLFPYHHLYLVRPVQVSLCGQPVETEQVAMETSNLLQPAIQRVADNSLVLKRSLCNQQGAHK